MRIALPAYMGRTNAAGYISICGLQMPHPLTVLALDGSDVRNGLGIQEGCNARQKVLAKSRVPGQNVRVASLLDVFNKQWSVILRKALARMSARMQMRCSWPSDLFVRAIFNVYDLLDALNLGRFVGHCLDPASGNKGCDGAA